MAIGSPKNTYVYTDDAGGTWSLKIASDRVAGVTPTTGLTVFNPASPPTGYKGRIKPSACRRVYAETTLAGRLIRRQFITTIGSTLYTSLAPQSVNYAAADEASAITLTSTGRRGEKFSF